MKEYLIGTGKLTPIPPAHLLYKLCDSRLLSKVLPINLRGGVMVIGKVTGKLEASVIASIITECLRREFEGALIALPPTPDEESIIFAKELSNSFLRKKIPLYLPVTYSSYCEASYLIPGICHSGSFSDYLSDMKRNYKSLSLELSLSAFEVGINDNKVLPITQEKLSELIALSNSMTFYSSSLCTNYFTYKDKFIMFDTPDTLKIKRDVAEKCGISTCFYFISPKNEPAIEKLTL